MDTFASPADRGRRLARREAWTSLLVWGLATAWSACYCGLTAYRDDVEALSFVLGFPGWVFWGVLIPWCVCTLLTGGFSAFLMEDEPLGDDRYEGAGDGSP